MGILYGQLADNVVAASHCTSRNHDCGNVICSSTRPWPVASCNAFDRSGCSQLLQKVGHCSTFPIIVEKK